MRTRVRFKIEDLNNFKLRLLQWSRRYNHACWLDSNGHSNEYSSFEGMLAMGAETSLISDPLNAFENLKQYHDGLQDWIFGYMSYDLKNDTEALESNGIDKLHSPDLQFFQPRKIIRLGRDSIEFLYLLDYENEIQGDFVEICSTDPIKTKDESKPTDIKFRISKGDYIASVKTLLEHIQRGDIYEANFCQEIYANNANIDPLSTYISLNSISKPPFAAYYKAGSHHVISASPERFLKKQADSVISQPIKGTAKRSADPVLDKNLKTALAKDPKERAENIMIVDLVRNDLSRYAVKGSVRVNELCEVYSYKQLHQMISTVDARIKDGVHPVDVIKSAFPMGSMTGAPKVSAMKLIEKVESSKRGVYSGALGYLSPSGDFDFSVVIRSIIYNIDKKYLNFPVGSAITSRAIPEREYDECLAKARAMYKVLVEPSPMSII